MNRLRPVLLAAALAGAATLTGGLVRQPLTAAQQAIAAHYTNNDPQWSVLRQATVGQDRARGLLTARFPPAVQALSGRPFRISGFMSPLETAQDTRHFIVTRRSTTCPFCPPNEPTEAVEVRLTAPARFTDQEVVVSGRMALTGSSDEGLFYSLSDASFATSQHG